MVEMLKWGVFMENGCDFIGNWLGWVGVGGCRVADVGLGVVG